MAQIKKPKYPSPGEVLYKGGFIDINHVLPAAVPTGHFSQRSPLKVLIGTTIPDWQQTAELAWKQDGTVVFEEVDRSAVTALAEQLVQDGKIGKIYPDDALDIGLPGIRSAGNPGGTGSSHVFK